MPIAFWNDIKPKKEASSTLAGYAQLTGASHFMTAELGKLVKHDNIVIVSTTATA